MWTNRGEFRLTDGLWVDFGFFGFRTGLLPKDAQSYIKNSRCVTAYKQGFYGNKVRGRQKILLDNLKKSPKSLLLINYLVVKKGTAVCVKQCTVVSPPVCPGDMEMDY